jgi:hypothetical protein
LVDRNVIVGRNYAHANHSFDGPRRAMIGKCEFLIRPATSAKAASAQGVEPDERRKVPKGGAPSQNGDSGDFMARRDRCRRCRGRRFAYAVQTDMVLSIFADGSGRRVATAAPGG